MGFKDGHDRVGGRAKGVPNKRTLDLMARLEEHGIEPVREILALMPELSPKEQVDVYRDLLTYLYPKRKALEVIPDPVFEPQIQILSNAEIIEIVKEARTEGRSE
jgi:hypothetical protein